MNILECKPHGNGTYLLDCASGNSRTELLLCSPLEVQTHILVLPPVSSDHIDGTVRIMLRSLHPGNPDSILSDYLVAPASRGALKAKGGPLPVFTALRETVEGYRKVGKAIVPGLALLTPFAATDGDADEIGILSCAEWAEIIRFRNGDPVAAAAVKTLSAKGVERTVRKLFDFPSLEGIGIFNLHIDDKGSVRVEDFPVCGRFRSMDIRALADTRSPIRAKDIEIFALKKKTESHPFVVLALALLTVNLAVAFMTVESRIGKLEAQYRSAKKEYGERLKDVTEIKRLTNEIQLAGAHDTKRQSAIDPYLVLSELTGKSPVMRIRTLSIQGRAFQFTAAGRDSLLVLSAVSRPVLFEKVTLQQSTPLEGGEELFTISGEITDDAQ